MTTSILDNCLLYRNKPTEELFAYFKYKGITIFDQLFAKYGNTTEAKQVVLFILCAYSEDSPLLVLRQDSKEEKEQICEYLNIPEYLHADLCNLTTHEVRRATTTYITQFAGPLFKSLMFMKIQLNDFEIDITNRNFGTSKTTEGPEGTTPETIYFYDIKEHGKAIAEHARLSKQIDQLEKQIRAQVKRHEGIDDLKHFLDKQKDSGAIKGPRSGNVENAIRK